MPDSKSWGGQFNTMSPPIQKLGGICPPNPPQGTPLFTTTEQGGPSIDKVQEGTDSRRVLAR